MPKTARYTREEILDIAYAMVREEGIESISARNLAKKLNTSTAPIFTAFSGIDEIVSEIAKRVHILYTSYISEGLCDPLPFKGAGMKYIEFAKREPKLFKFFFMSDNTYVSDTGYLPGGDSNEERVRTNLEASHGIDSETAKRIYNHLSIYAHGLAVLYAGGNSVFTEEETERLMSEAFMSFKEYFNEDNQGE
jgi:AcrR family transcriptional regulator